MVRFRGSSLEPFIKHVIVSEDTGYNKPHPGIFEQAFRVLGPNNKETVLMVGDSLIADITGEIGLGDQDMLVQSWGMPCCARARAGL